MKKILAVTLSATAVVCWAVLLTPKGQALAFGEEVTPSAQNGGCFQQQEAPPTLDELKSSVDNSRIKLVEERDNCGSMQSCHRTGCRLIFGGSQYVFSNGIKNCRDERRDCYEVSCLVRSYVSRDCSGEFIDESRVSRTGCKKQISNPLPYPYPEA